MFYSGGYNSGPDYTNVWARNVCVITFDDMENNIF